MVCQMVRLGIRIKEGSGVLSILVTVTSVLFKEVFNSDLCLCLGIWLAFRVRAALNIGNY